MDKLQYDSLYKFLVSLGLIMVALPVAVLAYLLNGELILISQDEFESLSKLSQQMISNRDKLLVILRYIFPWFSGLFILAGVGLLIYGLWKWKDIQKNLDKKLDAETTLQILNVLKTSPKEVNNKIESTVSESDYGDVNNKNDEIESEVSEYTHRTDKSGNAEMLPQSQSNHSNAYGKFMEIKKRCFEYAVSKYGKEYRFKQNIRIGNYGYDFIGVSQNNSIDLLVEVKYWKNISALVNNLSEFCHRAFDAGIAYETIMHRNFRWIVFVVTPKDQLQKAETLIKNRLNNLISEYSGKLEIQYIAEEDI